MRKITLLLFLSAFVFTGFAQKQEVKAGKDLVFEMPTVKGAEDITDTLVPASFLTGTPTIYSYVGSGVHFVTGTNHYGDQGKAQQYSTEGETYMVEGIQVWIAANAIEEGDLTFSVYDFDGEPTTAITSQAVPFSQVTTTTPNADGTFFYSVIFDEPAEVSGDFAVGLGWDPSNTAGFGLVSTTDGDTDQEFAWEEWGGGGWYTLADASSWGYFIDQAIFPMVSPAGPELIEVFMEDFEKEEVVANEDLNLTGWSNVAAVGERLWAGKEYNDNKYAQFSSYNSEEQNEAWLITPAINLAYTMGESLTFDVNIGYFTHEGLTVYISTDFDGDATTATWDDVTSNFTIPVEPTSGYGTFASAGTMDISAYNGEMIYVAFVYEGDGNAGLTTTYQIDNVAVYAETVGVEDEEAQSVSLFPNPVNDVLNIVFEANDKEVVISNVIGQAVIVKDVTSNRINVENLNAGIYVVTVVSENGKTRSERIVKQ